MPVSETRSFETVLLTKNNLYSTCRLSITLLREPQLSSNFSYSFQHQLRSSSHLLHPCVFCIQRLQLPRTSNFHATKPRLPLVKRWLTDSEAPADIGCSFTGFLFLQDLNDLFFGKPLLRVLFLSSPTVHERGRALGARVNDRKSIDDPMNFRIFITTKS